MKSNRDNSGVTLVEMLIVIAIIMILVSLVIGAAGRISNQAKEELTRNTMAIVVAALKEFHDYKYPYRAAAHAEFRFPLDCNDNHPALPDVLSDTLSAEFFGAPVSIRLFAGGPAQHLPEYSGCEGMYFFLSQVAECRKTLGPGNEVGNRGGGLSTAANSRRVGHDAALRLLR
ncbi:MAG: type II secretion system protein [Planctomycetota bacterium]|jgi:type II secretory pathway pseudopilin PulG